MHERYLDGVRGMPGERRRFIAAYVGSILIHIAALVALAFIVLQALLAGGTAPDTLAASNTTITVRTETAPPESPQPFVPVQVPPPTPAPQATPVEAPPSRPVPARLPIAKLQSKPKPKPKPKPRAQSAPPREIARLVKQAAPQPTPRLVDVPLSEPHVTAADASPEPETAERPRPIPTIAPTERPTERPTIVPTERPTIAPTERPTIAPTERPTIAPTERPTPVPTERPTVLPALRAMVTPAAVPTQRPTERATAAPAPRATAAATAAPTNSATSRATAVTVAPPPPAGASSGPAGGTSAASGSPRPPAPEAGVRQGGAATAPGSAAPPPAAEVTAATGLSSLNDKLRAALPTKPTAHMERVNVGAYSTNGALDAYERSLAPPLAILAKTFGLIYTTRTQRHADSVDYVYEKTRDLFGHEVCRAYRITEHPLRPVEAASMPLGAGSVAFPGPLKDVKPVIETVNVSCEAAGFIPVEPGSVTTPVPRHRP